MTYAIPTDPQIKLTKAQKAALIKNLLDELNDKKTKWDEETAQMRTELKRKCDEQIFALPQAVKDMDVKTFCVKYKGNIKVWEAATFENKIAALQEGDAFNEALPKTPAMLTRQPSRRITVTEDKEQIPRTPGITIPVNGNNLCHFDPALVGSVDDLRNELGDTTEEALEEIKRMHEHLGRLLGF